MIQIYLLDAFFLGDQYNDVKIPHVQKLTLA